MFRSSARVWAELHEQAFRRIGGATRVVMLDNLREGVVTANVYDPPLNPLYRDVLQHYGVTALQCFESLEEAQTYLGHWEAP